MKKMIFIITLALIVLMPGCSGANDQNVDPAELASALYDGVSFADTLILAEGDVAANYYKLDGNIEEHYIYISGSGATAEEIAVLKLSSADKGSAAQDIFDKRLDEQKLRFESYVPKEMSKLEDPVIEIKGNIAIMILSDDNQKAREIIKEYL